MAQGKFNPKTIPMANIINLNNAEAEPEVPETDNQPTPDKVDKKPVYRTYSGKTRSAKTLIAMDPETLAEAKERANKMGISFNEYIYELVDFDLHGRK